MLDLHAIDQEIREATEQLRGLRAELTSAEEGLVGLEEGLDRLDQELERVQVETRQLERAAEEKRDQLNRLRTKTNRVKTEKQYGAATLELDLVKQELRKLEDRALDKMQAVEDLQVRRKEVAQELEGAREQAGPQRQDIDSRRSELEDKVAILKDRRENLAIRLDDGLLGMYDRIRAGRSQVALAPLTDEGACGNCFTAVTTQQEVQIKEMSNIACCEGCGVILVPSELLG